MNTEYIANDPCAIPACPRRTNLTYPYCEDCTISEQNLRVAGSTLGLEALFGLFAWKEGGGPVFRKGQFIGVYGGKRLARREVAQLDARNKCYLIETQTNNVTYTDGSSTTAGVCRFINDPGDADKCNAEFRFEVPAPYASPTATKKNDKYRAIIVVALRDIFHKEEIFMDYGNDKFIAKIKRSVTQIDAGDGRVLRSARRRD